MLIRIGRWIATCLALLLLLLPAAPAGAGPLTPELQKAIRASTFEVVLKKPEKDPLSYEKPLPLELLPFSERTDAYNSVGTAFALGNNHYVTAAHVIQAGISSQFGAPLLRRSDGRVFEIDQILKYSMHQDFVVFSLKNDPAPAGFVINESPQIDDVVLAVGNALGQGIVIRDGLYTSSTPEDQDGRWKWIRFSAAASPGNSGGPLLDDSARVIGVVLAKSPNENLNYSLPITQVLAAPENKALLEGRAPTRAPYLRATQTYSMHDSFGLPLSWPAFERAHLAVMNKHARAAMAALLQANVQSLFPKGAGTESVVYDPQNNEFKPRLITQQQDGSWSAESPRYTTTDLPGDGSVAVAQTAGVSLLRIVRSDAAADAAFYADSKQAMDLVLKALDLRRNVGQDRVRIVSLGAATTDTTHADSYGRLWQQRMYALPFLNVYLSSWLLPTPEGYVGFTQLVSSSQRELQTERALPIADLFDVSYTGTVAQWRGYLARRTLLPKSLSTLQLDTGKTWAVRTPRFVLTAAPELVSLTDASVLQLTLGFMAQGEQVVWDVQGVRWAPDAAARTSLTLQRRMQPPASAKPALRTAFDDLRNRRPPYAGNTDRDGSTSWRMVRVVDVPGTQANQTISDVLYALTLRADSPTRFANSTLLGTQMAATVQVLEKGLGKASAAPVLAAPPVTSATSPTAAAAAFEDMAKKLQANMAGQSPPDLADNRNRQFADDLRDLLALKRKEFAVADANADRLMNELFVQTRTTVAYWKTVSRTRSNREVWPAYLARNGLEPTRPHGALVQAAEQALTDAQAASPVPQARWTALSQQLSRAYVQERVTLATPRPDAQLLYRSRTIDCPPPVAELSGGPRPAAGPLPNDLAEYYPSGDRRNGLEGAVLVSVRVSATGCAEHLAVASSSGAQTLDDAALRYAEHLAFRPAGQDGTPIAGQLTFRVKFQVSD